ncbi:2,3-dihydro-2,3-dihydroxybenzoate dehydrogenase [Streptomyces sp. NPDC050636]|uniref:2,3-dihydro-2,3-dihydroxybenzoate dehydrogenase n=1 Tax=Streptomyces sp. NPDC050636 TaxID=3154510 RepID=UPI0034491653
MRETELSGRTALVTGAGRGTGEAVARLLAERGARVVAVDRDADGVAALEAAHGAARITARAVDITDRSAVDELVDEAERTVGPLDILVNVAGVLRAGSVVELTDQDWADTFAVNTTGVFQVCRAVARRMTARRSGSIITVGSNAAGVPRAGLAAYTASKAAATLFTKSLGLELARSGVRCNVVSPGSMSAPTQRQPWTEPDSRSRVVEGDLTACRVGIPHGRRTEAVDIAEAVGFLVSDRARHITMHDLYADGGAALHA